MTLKRNFLFQNSDRGGATKLIFLPGAYAPPTAPQRRNRWIPLVSQTRFHLPTTMERVNNHKTICLRLLKEMEKTISNSTVNTIVSSTTERRLDFTSPLIELCTFTFTYSMDPFPAMFTHIHLSQFINLGKWIPHIFFLESTSIYFLPPWV